MGLPLAGIRVLELARILAGPWCGQLLADLGADIVKVERIGAGDDTRHWGPPFVPGAPDAQGEGGGEGGDLGAAYFHSCNRGKRSIAADFETPEGQALVRRLATHADVLIENFKVGGLKKYGLSYADLQPLNPRLVYCSITGFGQDGPYAARPGYDFLVQGMGGLMSLTGEPEGAPMKCAIAIVDVFTGLYAANAVQAALLRRAATGEGAYIDCALLDTAVNILGNQAVNYLVTGKEPPRMGNAHVSIMPYDTLEAADGALNIAGANDGQFRRLVQILGAADLAEDPAYRSNRDRVANRVVLRDKLNALTRRFTRAELLPRLEAAGVPAAPINGLAEVFSDPQVIARKLHYTTAHPHAAGGTIPALRSPIIIDGTAAASPRHAPELGAHTQEVLADPNWGG